MARDIRFYDVGAPQVGNGSSYFRTGADMFNKAFDIAQEGLTKHEQTLKENAQKAEMQATAKLSEIAKDRKLTQADYDSVQFYDKMKLEDRIEKQDKQKHNEYIDNETLGLSRQNIASQIAYRKAQVANAGGKLDPLSKMLAKFKIDKKMLDYKKSNGMLPGQNGKGSSGIDTIMKNNNLIYDALDSSKSTVDGDNFADYRSGLTMLKNAGVPNKAIDAAVAANAGNGNWMSGFTGFDEQTLDMGAVIDNLREAGYNI